MRQWIEALGMAGLLALPAVAPATAADPETEPGAEVCAVCHEDLAARMRGTAHGLDAADRPSCETCHGDGSRHVEEGDPELIRVPQGAAMSSLCLDCHRGTDHDGTTGAHGSVDVHCDSCHRVHPDSPSHGRLLVDDAAALCASCHPGQAASFERPFGHRLGRGGLECISCHNPHGAPGKRSLVEGRGGDGPCVSCHAEKRGPFVFTHVGGTTGDCTTCHEHHGSANPMQLTRSRVDQLCFECHSPIAAGTVGSQPPSSHDLRSPRYRSCTTCHVAVHGSNTSPALLR